MRHRAGTYMAACQRQRVDCWAKIEAAVSFMKPALGQKTADKAVHRALGSVDGAREVTEGHSRSIHHFFQDSGNPVDSPMVLRHAQHLAASVSKKRGRGQTN